VSSGDLREPSPNLAQLHSLKSDLAAVRTALAAKDFGNLLETAERTAEVTNLLLEGLEHDISADPELIASLQVYRNALILFRHLAAQEDVSNST
jgi:hypothetical protein